MKLYGFKKAEELIEANRVNIKCASLGMHEDWFWTAETVFEDGEYTKELFKGDISTEHEKYKAERKVGLSLFSDKYAHILIGGIPGSSWATPTLQLEFEDGTDEMIPCYVGEDIPFVEYVERKAAVQAGHSVLSGPCQDNITPLSDE